MEKQSIFAEMAALAIAKHPPKTQYECCLVSARISVAAGDIPESDVEFIEAAQGQAIGLFGPAFDEADYAQRATWIDMCERALREAANVPMQSD